MENIINKNKKTDRKNNKNLDVHWIQDTYFTIPQLLEENKKYVPTYKEITLRVKVQAAKDSKKISEIGSIPSGKGTKGRPKLVFAVNPVSAEILNSAALGGVNLHDEFEAVTVINISSNSDKTPTTQSRLPHTTTL